MTCPLPEVLEKCQGVQVLQRYDDADGTQHCDEITMSPLYPTEGTKKRVIEVIKDITPRKQLEEALQRFGRKGPEKISPFSRPLSTASRIT